MICIKVVSKGWFKESRSTSLGLGNLVSIYVAYMIHKLECCTNGYRLRFVSTASANPVNDAHVSYILFNKHLGLNRLTNRGDNRLHA